MIEGCSDPTNVHLFLEYLFPLYYHVLTIHYPREENFFRRSFFHPSECEIEIFCDNNKNNFLRELIKVKP